MIQFQNKVTINRSLQDVFNFVTDLEKLPYWNYFVIRVTKMTAGPLAAGAEYQQVRKTDSQRLRITEVEPPKAFTVISVPPSQPQLKRTMVFDGNEHQTEITDAWSLELGLPPILRSLGQVKASSAVRENLDKLKELLETGKTTLQDGRASALENLMKKGRDIR